MKSFFSLTLLIMSLCLAEAQSFKAVIQKGHGEVVKSAGFIKNGAYLITTSRDKTAKLWNAETGMEIRSFIGHASTVNGFDLYEDRLATSSADGTVVIWDITSGEKIWTSQKFKQYATGVAFSPDGKLMAIGSYEDSVSVLETTHYKTIKKLKTQPDMGVGYGVSIRFSPDGKYLSIGQDNRTTKVHEVSGWTEKYELKPTSGYCGGCGTLTDFDPTSRFLLKLSNGTTFTKYDLQSGDLIWETSYEFDDVVAVGHHSSSDYFLAATEDSMYIYKSTNNKLRFKWKLEGTIEDAAFHPAEDLILVALDKTTVLVDLEGNEVKRYQGILNETDSGLDYDLGNYWQHYIAKWVKYKSAQWLDNNAMFIGKTASKARKWDVKSASIQMEYIGHEKGILCFQRINDQLIATGGGDGQIIIWEESTGRVMKRIEAHREPIFDLALSNDNKMLASCSWDGVINVWDTDDWSRLSYIYNQGASAYDIEFSHNDVYLVTGLLDKTLRLWEINTKKFVKEYIGHTDVVTSINVQENEIITTGWDGVTISWDFYSGLIKQRWVQDKPLFGAKTVGDEIVTVGADRMVTFWDHNSKKINSTLSGHQAEINGIQISGNLMATSDVDGVTRFWDLLKRKQLFEHIQIGKNDWMIKTPEGYFDATDGAINNIHFVHGMEVYGASQFMEAFYKPGLAKDLFADSRTGKASILESIEKAPPPVVKLSGVAEGEEADLFLKVQDQDGGVKEIKLFHNGKRVDFEKHLVKSRSADNKTKVYSIRFPMVAGVNEFTATAASSSGIESSEASFSLVSDSKVPGSTCHILAVGINEYANSALNLNYAKPDANAFATKMKKQGEAIYAKVVLHPIYDKEATRQGIMKGIADLKDQVSVNDVFIFYFAGHGSMVDDQFYLVSSNASRLYDNQKINAYGIDAATLQQSMQEIKALKQLIVMDACQSGGSVEVLAQRGAPEEKAIAQLSRSTGIHVLAAAGSEQYATEFEALGHGLFTYALLEGISGAADGAPKDGKVTIYELKSYLDDQVPELSIKYKGTPQYPHTFSRGQDFPIVIVE